MTAIRSNQRKIKEQNGRQLKIIVQKRTIFAVLKRCIISESMGLQLS
jgi:hypothetical protein